MTKALSITAIGAAVALAATIGLGSLPTAAPAEEGIAIPAPALDETGGPGAAVAIFAGGCFWGVQGVFQHVDGVSNAVSGYAGGAADTAKYRTVGSGPDRPRRGRRDHLRSRRDQLRQAAPDLLLGRARPDRAQPAGSRRRHPVPLDDLPAGRRPGADRRAPTSPSSTRRGSTREPIATTIEPEQDLLSGRGLPPGLSDAEPDPAVHRPQRSAEDRRTSSGSFPTSGAPSRSSSAPAAEPVPRPAARRPGARHPCR